MALLNEAAREVACERVADSLGHLLAEIVGEELAYVHHRGEVFSGEPASATAFVVAANVAGVAFGRVRASAVVNEKAVVIERLAESYGGELAVGSHADGHG